MKRNNIILLSLAVVSLLLFAAIATNYDSSFISSMDEWINEFLFVSNKAFISFMSGVSFFASSEILMLLTIILMAIFFFKYKDIWLTLLLAIVVGGGVVLNLALKFIFQRGRPDDISNLEIFGYSFEWVSYSFPSGHSMRAFLFYGFVVYLVLRFIRTPSIRYITTLLFVIVILLIGVSRIVLDAHFPSDIIAAYFISLSWLSFCLLMSRIIYKQIRNKATRSQGNPIN